MQVSRVIVVTAIPLQGPGKLMAGQGAFGLCRTTPRACPYVCPAVRTTRVRRIIGGNMRTSRLTAFTVGALCMLVLGSGSAVAATGGKFILGRSNSATTISTITNAKGTALKLKAPAGKAPLAVSNSTKVALLNADKVDGLSAENIARATKPTGIRSAVSTAIESNPGVSGYDLLIAFADCPTGSTATGGGFTDQSSRGVVVDSSPGDDGTYWQVVVAIDPQDGEPSDAVTTWAVCYNPRGAVPTQPMASTSSAEAKQVLTPDLRRAVEQRAAVR